MTRSSLTPHPVDPDSLIARLCRTAVVTLPPPGGDVMTFADAEPALDGLADAETRLRPDLREDARQAARLGALQALAAGPVPFDAIRDAARAAVRECVAECSSDRDRVAADGPGVRLTPTAAAAANAEWSDEIETMLARSGDAVRRFLQLRFAARSNGVRVKGARDGNRVRTYKAADAAGLGRKTAIRLATIVRQALTADQQVTLSQRLAREASRRPKPIRKRGRPKKAAE